MSTSGLTSADLLRDIRAEFLGTYRDVIGQNPNLGRVMALGIPSTKRTEYYGYHESPPNLERVDRGEDVSEDAHLVRAYSVENVRWAKAVGYHEDDLEDLQLGSLRDIARGFGKRAAALPEQVFFQILTGATNPRLLKAVPNAPDGAALFATTADGAARFGATGGNLLTGSGVASAADVRSDIWAAIEQFKMFQDTEGEPLLDEGVIDRGITIVYNPANSEVMAEAFKQARTLAVVQNVAGDQNVGGAAVSNTLLESGQRFTLWATQRITDNDIYVVLDDIMPKIIFEQVRQAPRSIEETRENSERARRSWIFGSVFDLRSGFGVNLPYGAIKINN